MHNAPQRAANRTGLIARVLEIPRPFHSIQHVLTTQGRLQAIARSRNLGRIFVGR